MLRGEDIRPYTPDWASKWLINSHNGVRNKGIKPVNVQRDYKAVYNWLSQFSETLRKRQDQGDHWTNLRNCAYVEEFSKPKIVYPNMTKYMPFVYDKDRFFTNQKCFIITGNDLGYLTAFFNSRMFRFAFKEYFPELLGDTRELSKVFFENVTVKPVDSDVSKIFIDLVEQVQHLKKQQQPTSKLEAEIDNRLAVLYDLSDADRRIIKNNQCN